MRKTLEKRIIEVVTLRKGIAVSQICRNINERGLSYCNQKSCYANKGKRERQFIPDPICRFSQKEIRIEINELEEEGKLKTKRERKTDSWQARGWDWMRGVYLPKDFPVDKLRSKTL